MKKWSRQSWLDIGFGIAVADSLKNWRWVPYGAFHRDDRQVVLAWLFIAFIVYWGPR